MNMKVIVATDETQGRRNNDFSFTNEGELVRFGTECDGESIDGRCGCRRSMCGVESHKATTTMKVLDIEITREEICQMLNGSNESGGWKDLFKSRDEYMAFVVDEADELIRLANSFDVGDVLERRGSKVQRR